MRIDLNTGSAQALGQMKYATSVASNNINNAANPYYARQTIVFTTNSAGVLTANPIRMSNAFLNQQMHTSNAEMASTGTVYSMAKSVDKVITGISADADGGSSNALQQALSAINESLVSLAAEDSGAARTTFLSRLDSFFATSQTMLGQLDDYKSKLNDDLSALVDNVNQSAQELARINDQIRKNPKNNEALLTQRDQLLGELSQYTKIQVDEQENGTVVVRIAGGQELVNGNEYTPLTKSVNDDGSTSVFIHGVDLTKTPERVGGALGGTVQAYNDIVSKTESQISHLMVGFAAAINEANMQGYKPDGTAGGALIDIPTVSANGKSGNSGNGRLDISIDYKNLDNLSTGGFTMEVTSAGYEFYDESTGDSMVVTSFPAEVFGMTIDGAGSFDMGDKFEFNPVPEMAKGMSVTSSADDIAAAGNLPITAGDNQNLLNLSDVMSDKVFGDATVVDHLGNVFVDIGNAAKSAENAHKTATSINTTAKAEWSNFSAVSTQEEELNILKYQQIYNSVSKVIQTSKQMFDTLFNSI
ncbi:flagellar hook-associated protein FlgK [Vibrio sp. D431a]|uniref:flagellar hook-associated protein FlgK n=1 Tax=Vibrio sp. D431a TaxID=2837388 RepID=UPI0025577B9A|nr:flagellar basal body rod C-terminal domain-containing protein [Vibrio sp. D431a]MDK9793931.1 hypothetical protein [Vibrio sp. D431a]